MSNKKPTYEELGTRIKQLEDSLALYQKNNLLTELLNGIPEPIILIDVHGKIIFTNSISGQVLNTTVDNLIGRSCYDFMPPDLAESRRSLIESVVKTGKTILFEDQFKEHRVLNRISPVFLEDNIVSYLSVLSMDVTDLKITEDALKESVEKYKTVFENSAEGIILIDDTGTITDWNKFLENKTGFSKGNAIGKKIWNLHYSLLTEEWKKKYPKDTLEKIWMNLINSLSENEIVSKEGQYIGKEGILILTEDIICPMILSGKRNLCVIQRDLTERRKAEQDLMINEQQLKLLNATKDKLFSIIAHDLKSYFNTILGFSEVLKENLKVNDVEKSQNYLEAINSSAKNTLNLLANLLEWASTQTGQINFNPTTIILQPIIDEVVDLLDSSAKLKSISIRINIPDDTKVSADRNMLKTILQNLILNAIKFTNNGGSVNISAKLIQNAIEIVIADDGTGIDNATLEKLFTLNTIVPKEGTANEKGSGLGLVICREFVEKHGGKIRVESQSGIGSIFSFTLPFIDEVKEIFVEKETIKATKEDDQIKKIKILVADDEHHTRTLLELLMQKYSKEILFAKNGVEAVEFCKKYPDIDLILMDKTMPSMDGYEATRQIRKFNKKVVIFIQSAFQSMEEKENLIKAGGNDFIAKPIPRNILNDLIRKYFGKPE
jgi:PAS domain S-box-containing protein